MKKYLIIIFLCLQIVCYSENTNRDNKIKILVGSPIHRKATILKEFLESLKRIEKDVFILDYFFVDDNNDDESKKLLEDFKSEIDTNCLILHSKNDIKYHCDETRHYWNEKLVDKVATFKDHMIQIAINAQYDYLFLIDSDIVIHPKTIKQLIASRKDIISNIFWTKNTNGIAAFPQVWISDEYTMYKHEWGERISQAEINKRTNEFLNMLKKPGVYEVGGLGACTLISKRALNSGVSFQNLSNLTIFGEDRHFCIRAIALGLSLHVDTHFPAYHIYRESELEGIEEFKKNCKDTDQIVYSINYPSYQNANVNLSRLWYFMESCGNGSYLEPCFQKHIDKNQVSSILELGSRDLRDSIRLSEYFKCHVFGFECNPECLEVCRVNDQKSPNVTLVEKAAWNKTDTIDFFPTIHEKGKISDPGSSSCFKMMEKTLTRYAQKATQVPSIRLDDWMQEKHFKNIDLICMDTQGATLKILEGMGEFLKKTKYIITECETNRIYENECVLPDLVSFLKTKGFELVTEETKPDYLFINKNLIK